MSSCPIWGTPAELIDAALGTITCDSPRAGGPYKLTHDVEAELKQQNDKKFAKVLTGWLCRQRRAGIPTPRVTMESIEAVRNTPPMKYHQKADQVLLYFDRRGLGLGEYLNAVANTVDKEAYLLLAEAECADTNELFALLNMMHENAWITGTPGVGFFRFAPSEAGWSRIEQLTRSAPNIAQGFVAMWFDKSTEDPYENGIAKAIFDCGYDPKRVDNSHHHLNKVDDEIVAEIRKSRFCVADFTCPPKQARGGVYFETGFAMGLDIPIIWTCKSTSKDDLHFDTRQYPHILWEDTADLYKQLKDRIGALLGTGPKAKK